MNEVEFREVLEDFLNDVTDQDTAEEHNFNIGVMRVSSYENGGMLTRNEGLIVRLDGGDEFQVTIVQSKRAGE